MTNDLIERLADRLFQCDCSECEAARIARLIADLELAYGCTTTAEFEAKRKVAIQ